MTCVCDTKDTTDSALQREIARLLESENSRLNKLYAAAEAAENRIKILEHLYNFDPNMDEWEGWGPEVVH